MDKDTFDFIEGRLDFAREYAANKLADIASKPGFSAETADAIATYLNAALAISDDHDALLSEKERFSLGSEELHSADHDISLTHRMRGARIGHGIASLSLEMARRNGAKLDKSAPTSDAA